jgi:uncharacterized repeat protein (TIGR03803 family)
MTRFHTMLSVVCFSAFLMTQGPTALGQANAPTPTVLYSFTGSFNVPAAGGIMDNAGNFYGTTSGGGSAGLGSVFKVDATGHETVLYNFNGSSNGDGENPNVGLVLDSAGNLYGTTLVGGTTSCPNVSATSGCGIVFKLDPTGHETVLHTFTAANGDGASPRAGLIMDSGGSLYGTTEFGGSANFGTVFKLDPTGNETVLYAFTGVSGEGVDPNSSLVMDKADNLYGTVAYGSTGLGGIFKLDTTGQETLLYSFTGTNGDGESPVGGLILDSAGNLYGVTTYGGNLSGVCAVPGCGIVFKLDSSGNETVLYSFTGTNGDGLTPRAGLTIDRAGNLFGTTSLGGTGSYGTIFKIDPTGHETVLYNFADQGSPDSNLIMDSAGNFYGTTSGGGSSAGGTLFKLDTTGHETVLYSFPLGNGDGKGPTGGLVMDSAGNFYGTTAVGGVQVGACSSTLGGGLGCGTAFKVDSTGHETVLHTFTGAGDGANPQGGLIMDRAGNLYGTTLGGGFQDTYGTVFKIDATGQETVLYEFASGANADGTNPSAGLIMDTAGSLYGTTLYGGAAGLGTVFKLDNTSHETVLYSFTGVNGDGVNPYAGLFMDNAGNLYGTTLGGGINSCPLQPWFPGVSFSSGFAGCGVVFKLDPTGHETVLYSFTGTNGDGAYPAAPLTMDVAGNLYGTTYEGGTGTCPFGGCGTIFKLDPTGHEAVLYSFPANGGGVGGGPVAGLIIDNAGNLYGTAYNAGIIFKVDATGHETVLVVTGQGSQATLIMDTAGNLYGTTVFGGPAASGTLFKLPPLPTVNFSTTGQTFASQLKGTTSSPQAVTLTNTGNATLSISNVTISGVDPSDFSETNTCGGNVAPGANCSINVTFTPTSTGNRTATVSITYNAPGGSQSVSLSGTGTDFSVGVAAGGSTTATISAGQTATYNLQVSPLSGFTGLVSIACTGAPSQAICNASGSSLSLTGGSSAPFSVTINTTARGLLPPSSLRHQPWPSTQQLLQLYKLLAIVFALLMTLNALRRNRLRSWATAGFLFACLGVALIIASGCGAGGSSAPPPPTGTPGGTYTLTVTGTSQGQNRTLDLTLVVN